MNFRAAKTAERMGPDEAPEWCGAPPGCGRDNSIALQPTLNWMEERFANAHRYCSSQMTLYFDVSENDVLICFDGGNSCMPRLQEVMPGCPGDAFG